MNIYNYKMVSLKNKLIYCIIGNLITLISVLFVVSIFDESDKYWRFGPNDHLIIINVKIDNYTKYGMLMMFIAFINIVKVLSEEIGMPILGFNVYNPDKTIITDFSKNELQFFANTMFMISSIRDIFMILLTISQVDVALWSVLIREFASFFTIRMLLNEKTFTDRELTECIIEI